MRLRPILFLAPVAFLLTGCYAPGDGYYYDRPYRTWGTSYYYGGFDHRYYNNRYRRPPAPYRPVFNRPVNRPFVNRPGVMRPGPQTVRPAPGVHRPVAVPRKAHGGNAGGGPGPGR